MATFHRRAARLSLLIALGCGGNASVPVDAGHALDGAFAKDTILFGGSGLVATTGDTWAWDGSAWTQLDVTGPSPRQGAAMASLHGTLVLVGGEVQGQMAPIYPPDTWTWDGRAWISVAASGPNAGEWSSMAPLGDTLVLFGGTALTDAVSGGEDVVGVTFSEATWTWDGTQWTHIDGQGPEPRFSATMAPLGDKVVLFGGMSANSTYLGDTWTFDGSTWTQLDVTGPSARASSVMAPLGDTLVLFGGSDGSTDGADDTWTFDGTSWTKLAVSGPPGRSSAMLTPSGGVLVLFGGVESPSSNPYADTWAFDGTAWTSVAMTGPDGRSDAVMATP